MTDKNKCEMITWAGIRNESSRALWRLPSIFLGEIFVDVGHSFVAVHYLPISP